MAVREARPFVLDAIAAGLKVPGARLDQGVEVSVAPERRNTAGWPAVIVAARIVAADFDGEVGAWAIADERDGNVGPIFALDSVAREWSEWGEAAQPGSPVMETVERLAGYAETRQAREAVRSRA